MPTLYLLLIPLTAFLLTSLKCYQLGSRVKNAIIKELKEKLGE